MEALNILLETTDVSSPRFKHLTMAYNIAKEITNDLNIPKELKEKIVNTVLLHDIGYSEKINSTKLHSLDGYNYLHSKYPDICFEKCILLHSDFPKYCPNDYSDFVSNIEDNLSELEQIVLIILDYCDIHSNGFGKKVSLEERWEDLTSRHANNPTRLKEVLSSKEYAIFIDKSIEYNLEKLESLY